MATELADSVRSIRSHYRSGDSDLGKDFFVPCLSHCKMYRRAAGYFSSSALLLWSEALSNLVRDDSATVSLLVSPNLSGRDIKALSNAISEKNRKKLRSRLVDDFLSTALNQMSSTELERWRVDLFSWMVANERLSPRFAFPKHASRNTLFHEKIGIFDFPDGSQIAFTGSANETYSGYHGNYESIDVYRSWVPSDKTRVQTKVGQFEEAWSGNAKGLEVHTLSDDTLRRIRSFAPSERPPSESPDTVVRDRKKDFKSDADGSDSDGTGKWRHQDEAIELFLQKHRGILEMATGTGKTRTALRIMNRLFNSEKIKSVVVTTKGKDLLEQWRRTLDNWFYDEDLRIQLHYGPHHELKRFARSPSNAILVVSRMQLPNLFRRLSEEDREQMLIVHDEAHGLGADSLVQNVEGEHSSFAYTLGLTATPEREYDEKGNEFIKSEIGDVIYEFGLTKAIERGILCEFDYIPIKYDLTPSDRKRLKAVFKKKKAREANGKEMSDEELARDLSLVYKTSELKPERFYEYIENNPDIMTSTVLFVATKAYGEKFLEKIHNKTYRYRTYYGEDDAQELEDFANEDIDILITCHKISEGIDVPGLENVILGSSQRARLETIQRIGRCLRTDPEKPNKRATVVDFICVKDRDPKPVLLDADRERMEWLSEIAKTKNKE